MSSEQRLNNLGIDPELEQTDPAEFQRRLMEEKHRILTEIEQQEDAMEKKNKESNMAETSKELDAIRADAKAYDENLDFAPDYSDSPFDRMMEERWPPLRGPKRV